ncbi:unnamed protein product [Effrenium voratum]|uniref:Uncharacterized protein n=1 Tax=Effrenium voratum TaxID=2562239 RepID=A0AA36N174_9DINO|nr:unnamed protein product [Effrenium voratum]
MPPKSRSKSLARIDSQKKIKKIATATISEDKKAADLKWLEEVNSSIGESLVPRVFQLLGFGLAQGERQFLRAGSSAVERICEDNEGFISLVKAKGVETMLSFLRHLPQAQIAPATSEAVNAAGAAIFRRAAAWLDEVDEVDFDQLQHVLYLAFWLGGEDEDVALSALGAFERFTLYRTENGATLLQSEVIQVLHRIIGHNRAPELVSEAFTLLYRLCDAPAAVVVPLLTDENGIIQTVVESMTQAPLNMRLQLAGLRLLALWSQYDVGEDPADQKDLKLFIREANAYEVSRDVISNLTRAGLSHAATWMSTISSRLPQRVRGRDDEPRGRERPR